MVATFTVTLAKSKAPLSDWLRRFLQARKRKTEHEREFYRGLGAYCRANNLSPICEDDWKSAAYLENDNCMINAKGDVLWTKANLHR